MKKVVRVAAVLAGTSLALSGCGGGGGDDDGGPGPATGVSTPADLSSKSAVAMQVGNIGQLISLASNLNGPRLVVSGAKAPATCEVSGTTEEYSESRKVKSLIDGQERSLQIFGTRDVACKDLETADDDQTSLTLTTTGREEFAESGSYAFSAYGTDDATYQKNISIQRNGQPRLDFLMSFRLRSDSQDTEAGAVEKSFFSLDGSVGGQSFGLRLGSAAKPFSLESNGAGGNIRMNGDYAFAGGLAACKGASGSIKTLEPLTATDTLDPTDNLFSAGKLEISANGKKATVTYSGNSITVTDSGGVTSSVTAAEALQAATSCAGPALVVVEYVGED